MYDRLADVEAVSDADDVYDLVLVAEGVHERLLEIEPATGQ